MQFALNQMGFPDDDLERTIDILAAAGYDGLEPNLTEDGPLWEDNHVATLKSRASEADLVFPGVATTLHWQYSLSSPDSATRERGLEIGERMIEIADALNAGAVLIVPALVDDDCPYNVAYERGLEAVQSLAGTAADHNVTVAIENVWNNFLLSPLEFRSFVDEAAAAGPVGAYFDVGNVRRFGRPEQWLNILGDRVVRVHVKDYRTDVDTIDGFTYPLQGDLSWEAIDAALDELNYDGWITAEVPPYETYPEQMPPQVLANLQRIFAT